tara:strand:- start:29930 stop:30439 length:510 start_codon:yes stop_codon:yes gene_type:complete
MCSLSRLLVLLALLLVSFGCGQKSDPEPLDAAMELQAAGKTDAAIHLLAAEDIEKNFQASSLRTLKMSEKQFLALTSWRQKQSQEELFQMVPLIKRAVYFQIEQMQAAEAADQSAEAKRLREQIERLIRNLQDKNRVLIYQQLGGGIDKKLKQVTSKKQASEAESTAPD